ncbi:hypothetical protein IWQ61_010445 [Dispira simplex]|nr:hypothetical protein IWQ61_010445 [Dispira simplex]
MANNAAKKLAIENAKTIKRLKQWFYGVNLVYVLGRFIWQFSSVTWGNSLGYVTTFLVSFFVFQQLVSMGQPYYNEQGELIRSGEDLSLPGLTSYMFDVLYVTWFVHLGTLWSDLFWYLYVLLPGYAIYALGGYVWPYLSPWLGNGSGNTAPSDIPINRQDKKSKKAKQPRAKYVRS